MKRNEIIKRDNLLVEFILAHKGSENAVSSEEISKHLSQYGYLTKPANISMLIIKLINERHLPICSLNSKGYYWAKNKQDILDCISHLQSRIDALQDHIEHLKNFIME